MGETIHTLAHCSQEFAARRQDADIPNSFEPILDQDRSSSLNNSLAAIQDDQHPLAVQECNQSASVSSNAISSPSAEASFRATNNVPREVHSRPRRLRCHMTPAACSATAKATDVLPMPSGPTIVTKRCLSDNVANSICVADQPC